MQLDQRRATLGPVPPYRSLLLEAALSHADGHSWTRYIRKSQPGVEWQQSAYTAVLYTFLGSDIFTIYIDIINSKFIEEIHMLLKLTCHLQHHTFFNSFQFDVNKSC